MTQAERIEYIALKARNRGRARSGTPSEANWHALAGRELRVPPLAPHRWTKVVACVSIWQDTPALRQTLPTWLHQVDGVVVADGPWAGIATPESTDGLHEYLDEIRQQKPVLLLDGPWENQRAKRTVLLRSAAAEYPDALLVILDADESVLIAEDWHQLPEGDVQWVSVMSGLYTRPQGQPRMIRAMPGLTYKGRHHWLYAGDRLLATHQYGGVGISHHVTTTQIHNARGLGHSDHRRQQKRMLAVMQRDQEAATVAGPMTGKSDESSGGRETLRIMQTTTYDAGMVAFRFHTALNATTPHASVMASSVKRDVFGGAFQYNLDRDERTLAGLAASADIAHCHLDYGAWLALTARKIPTVIHHHGTMFRRNVPVYDAMDREYAGLRLVSNLELTKYSDGLRFLPNPMPVALYQGMRKALKGCPNWTFRVAHSPSKRALKGTEAFLAACDTLRGLGIPIEPVLIEQKSLTESLAIKATCDAAFDSFWLGLQCSGLEAAAMGLPVIAGDEDCKRGYEQWLGQVPYTYANDQKALVDQLARLAQEPVFYQAESERVHDYVVTHHDEAAVALRYLDLLDEAFQWRSTRSFAEKVA